MWTPTTRRQHSRDHLHYGSDLSDAEWEIIAPFMPPPAADRPAPRMADGSGDMLLIYWERRCVRAVPWATHRSTERM